MPPHGRLSDATSTAQAYVLIRTSFQRPSSRPQGPFIAVSEPETVVITTSLNLALLAHDAFVENITSWDHDYAVCTRRARIDGSDVLFVPKRNMDLAAEVRLRIQCVDVLSDGAEDLGNGNAEILGCLQRYGRVNRDGFRLEQGKKKPRGESSEDTYKDSEAVPSTPATRTPHPDGHGLNFAGTRLRLHTDLRRWSLDLSSVGRVVESLGITAYPVEGYSNPTAPNGLDLTG
jgi:hypothetical protein